MDPALPSPTIEDLQEAAPRVLARLREMATFPANGTVAGQAVASLFWEELGLPMRGPVNDIDVFVNANMPRELRGGQPKPEKSSRPKSRTQSTVSNYKGARVMEDAYGKNRYLAMRASIAILRTYTAGLVNYTLVSPTRRSGQVGHTLAQSQELVDEFDLNLVSVGINLDLERVVASPGFLKFLEDGKVCAQTCNTPAHTLVRLVNKLHCGQLTGVQCDYPAQRKMLELAITCQEEINKSLPIVAGDDEPGPRCITRFGSPKYRKLAQKFAHLLPATYTKVNSSGYEFTHFTPSPISNEQDKWLFDHALSLIISDRTGLIHRAYVSRFPKLYAIFHPEMDPHIDPANAATRQQLFKDVVATGDQGQLFKMVHAALGKDVHDLPLQQMPEVDAINFFFDQGLDADQCQHLAAQWNALPPLEARILAQAGASATDFQKILADPDQQWLDLFTSHCQVVYSTLSSVSPQDPAANGAHHLSARFLDWLSSAASGAAASSGLAMVMRNYAPFTSQISVRGSPPQANLETIYTRWDTGSSVASRLLAHLDPADRQSLGYAMLNTVKRPPGATTGSDSVVGNVVGSIEMNLDIDQAMHEKLLDQASLSHCLLTACLNMDLDSHPHAADRLEPLLGMLDPKHAFANKAQVLRSIACTNRGMQMLHAQRTRFSADPALGPALADAISHLDEEISAGGPGGSLALLQRDPVPNLERARALFESWALSIKTAPAVLVETSPRPSPRF